MRADEPCANAVTVDGGVIETSADTGGCWAEFKAAAVTTDDGGMYHCILNKTDAQPVEILQNTFFRSNTLGRALYSYGLGSSFSRSALHFSDREAACKKWKKDNCNLLNPCACEPADDKTECPNKCAVTKTTTCKEDYHCPLEITLSGLTHEKCAAAPGAVAGVLAVLVAFVAAGALAAP